MSKIEDENLVEEQYEKPNSLFYTANPAAYLKRRLHALLITAGAGETVVDLLSKGVTYNGVEALLDLPHDAEAYERETLNYISVEAEVLFHHASEAMFRLFFAHMNLPACPWLECARLRSFSKFKDRVSAIRSTPIDKTEALDERRAIAEVFMGRLPEQDEPEKGEALSSLIRLLRFTARKLLTDANFYNSAKHGLAVTAGEASITVGDEGSDNGFGHSGASVSYLETIERSPGKRWTITTQWVNTAQTLQLIMLVIMYINSLWEIAKARYITTGVATVKFPSQETVDEALKGSLLVDLRSCA